MNNIPDNLREVGLTESFSSGKREIFRIYIDDDADELSFYIEIDGGNIIPYPSACRISDFTFTYSGVHYYYDEETKRHYCVNPFYDGEIFYLYANSVTELLELIRQFTEPSDELSDILEKTPETQKHYTEIRKIYNREKD